MVVNAVLVDAMTEHSLRLHSAGQNTVSFIFSAEPLERAVPDFFLVASAHLAQVLSLPAAPDPGRIIAYGPAEDLAASFAAGCADYLKLPWTTLELVLRLNRLDEKSCRFTVNGREFRLAGHYLSSGPLRETLTREERAVLRELIRHAPEPVPRRTLRLTLGPLAGPGSRSVDMHVHALRRKIGRLSGVPNLDSVIFTARFVGYGLR